MISPAALWRVAMLLGLMVCSMAARALSPEQALAIAQGDSDARIAALNERVTAQDAQLAPFVEALLADEVRLAGGKVYLVRGAAVTVVGSGASATLPEGAEEVVNNNRMRQALEGALAAFRLSSPDPEARAKALADLRDVIDEGLVPLLDRAAAKETDASLKAELAMLKAKALIGSADASRRLAAAELLASSPDPAVLAADGAACAGR